MLNKLPPIVAVAAAGALGASVAQAVEMGGIELSGTGFASLVAGKMVGGTRGGEASDYQRPIFVADYAQGGIYDGRSALQWKPDTKVGLQGQAVFPGKRLSVTGQVVSRGARDGDVNLEWLYASYKLNDAFTLQAGRKRIPMFYYSDTQDIGFALPWTHLPSGPYGWEAVNYNGVNLSYQGLWGDWSSAIDLIAGNEALKNSGYWKVYSGKRSRTNIRWDDILGGDIVLSRDWLETRFVYIQSKMREKNTSGRWDSDPASPTFNTYINPDPDYGTPATRQQIYGLAFNVDYHRFLLRSEIIYIDHDASYGIRDNAYLFGIGYRLGKWTPMVTMSEYWGKPMRDSGLTRADMEATRLKSFTLRYDLTTSSAVKLQYDMQKDRSGSNYTLDSDSLARGIPTNRYGDSRLVTVSYDLVF